RDFDGSKERRVRNLRYTQIHIDVRSGPIAKARAAKISNECTSNPDPEVESSTCSQPALKAIDSKALLHLFGSGLQ
ncbi:hypothetical protein HW555_001881, partial [Spodoptera exigua]